MCVLRGSESSSVVKVNYGNSPPLWLVGPLTAMASVLGWRNQPFLILYRCLRPLVTLAGCGCYRPTPKSVACFGQISVGWREPGLTCHFLVKLHLQSWKTVVTRMLITPKSGYISGCFDSFPHITSVLKEASLLLVKYWLDFSAHIRGPAWFCPAPPRTPNQAPPPHPPPPNRPVHPP